MRIFKADNNKDIIDAILAEVADKVTDHNCSIVLLVPEKLSLSIERELLFRSPVKAITNVSVITPSRLLHKLINSDSNYIPKEAGVMIIKKLILDNYDKLVCFKKTAKTMGFAQNIYDTISQLKNSRVTPEDYYERVQNVGTSLKIKLQDIFLLYSEYEKFISQKSLIDASDRFDLLASLILTSPQIKKSDFYCFGFDNMSNSGMQVFKNICKTAKSVTFGCVDFYGKNNSYIYKPEMLENVNKLAEELLIFPTEIMLNSNKNSVMSHIRDNLYAYPYSKKKITSEVNLLECKTIEDEVKFVAERIRRRIIEDKVRYADLAVICSNLNSYAGTIRTIFADYEIPIFIDEQEKFSSHPLVRFFVSLFGCYRRNFASDEFIALFKNYFCGLEVSVQNELENYINKYGINYDKFKSPFDYGKEDKEGNPLDSYKIVETARIEIVGKLLNVFDKFNDAKCCSDQIKATKSIFEEFLIDDKISTFSAKLATTKEYVNYELTKQIKGKFLNLLDMMEDCLGTTKLTFDEFYSIFMSGIEANKVSLIPTTIDNCFVGDFSTSKLYSYKDIYVLGATEGSFPVTMDDCGIILDKEIATLSDSLNKKIEPTIRTINQRERYKVISCLESFTEHLVITYSKVNANGEETNPSSTLLDIAKIFYDKDINSGLEIVPIERVNRIKTLYSEKDRQNAYAYEFATKKVAEHKLMQFLREYKKNKISANSFDAINSLFATLKEENKNFEPKIISYANTRQDKLLNSKQLMFTNSKTSISQLECYFLCPFKFFADYGLRIKEKEESNLKSVDFGNCLHKIAELYIKNIDKYESGKSIVEKKKRYQKLIDYVFEQEKIKVATNKHIVLLLKKEAERLIQALNYQYQLSNFKPKYEELVFGENGDISGVDLGKGIMLEGKIDRVDVLGDCFRVVDYKTGKIDLRANNIYYGNKIQLFMYLNALATKNFKPVGSFYFPIKDIFSDEEKGAISTYTMEGYYVDDIVVAKNMDTSLSLENPVSNCIKAVVKQDKKASETNDQILKQQSFTMSDITLGKIMEYCLNISQNAVEEILAGNIAPTPLKINDGLVCDYCKYKNVCRRNQQDPMSVRVAKRGIGFENFVQTDALGKE